MKLNKYKTTLITIGLLMILPIFVQATTPPSTPPPINVYNPIDAESVPQLIESMVRAILGIVGALALLMFIYGGVLWLTSLGNKERIDKGRNVLIWATVGLVIIFSSYAILTFVFEALS